MRSFFIGRSRQNESDKKINNNVAICLDSNNCELVAFVKGIGFPKIPYDLQDLSLIDRTFYDLDSDVISLFNEIPESVMQVSMEIIDKAKAYLQMNLSDAFVFTLADHLHFTIQRCQEGMVIENPLIYELQHLYVKETELAQWARRLVYRRLLVRLPKEEANIAMHFINAQSIAKKQDEESDLTRIIEDVTSIIEKELNLLINRDDFNYSRFIMHLQYLLKRKDKKIIIQSSNLKMFKKMKDEFTDVYQCVLKIKEYFGKILNWQLNDEELLYLMLHVNRFYSREGL